jgi:beta-glucanase (GH16 family)
VTSSVQGDSEGVCYSPGNVTFFGGGGVHLLLTATQSTCGGRTKPYTGAAITTNPYDGRNSGGFEFTYGFVEAKVYLAGAGDRIANWPAVWTSGQNWPEDGENDIVEGLSGQACFHFHSPAGGPGGCDPRITPGWHTFGSDWEPGSVTYYYDGVDVGTITTGITDAPHYLAIAIGPGDADLTKPADLQVAYVRVWQHP